MYAKWWKFLAAFLLLYVLVGGMIVPLAPGVTQVEPSVFRSDSLYTFQIHTFNAHVGENAATRLWFKNGSQYFCVDSFKIQNNNLIVAKFEWPSAQKAQRQSFDIVLNNDKDGTFALRDAVTLVASVNADTNAVTRFNKIEECDVEVSTNKHSGLAFPYREILYESIRNTFYHVPMWFAMLALLVFSLVHSILYLSKGQMHHDILASSAVVIALLFGVLGLLTGMMWANYTWGQPWVNDPKLNGAAVGVIMYFAYLLLRGSLNDEIKRAKISAVYNIFAVIIFILFIFVIPRLTDSLHPGNGGNPAFSKYDLDSSMRLFFYPAVIGWVLLGFWILSLLTRIRSLEFKQTL